MMFTIMECVFKNGSNLMSFRSLCSALGGEGHEEDKSAAPIERRKLQLLPRGATSGDVVSSPVSQTPEEAAPAAEESSKMTEEDAKRKIKNMLDEFYGIKDKNVSEEGKWPK
jgi:translation initiation factor 4G